MESHYSVCKVNKLIYGRESINTFDNLQDAEELRAKLQRYHEEHMGECRRLTEDGEDIDAQTMYVISEW